MICFEVRVNGKVLCTAGVGDLGVLTTIMTWVKRHPHRRPESMDEKEWCKEELSLSVSGSTPRDETDADYLDWIGTRFISVGDEIILRVINQADCDPPKSVERKQGCSRTK